MPCAVPRTGGQTTNSQEIAMYTIPLHSRTATGLAFQRWLVQRLAALASAG